MRIFDGVDTNPYLARGRSDGSTSPNTDDNGYRLSTILPERSEILQYFIYCNSSV